MNVLRVAHARDVVPVAFDDDRLVREQYVDLWAEQECQQDSAAEMQLQHDDVFLQIRMGRCAKMI